jgi:hypothetical protein
VIDPGPGVPNDTLGSTSRPMFAHASEAEMARILEFYGVAWRYEPTTFPILWNLDGDVVESSSPDFYLPDLNLYVELTTLKQSLVRRKNRKLRRLRELYPDIRIKLFYARDFRMLLLKFGRLALEGELTGTTGQSTPPRIAPDTTMPADAGQGSIPTSRVPAPDRDGAAAAPDGDRGDPLDATVPDIGTGEARGRRRGRRRHRSAASQTMGSAAMRDESAGAAATDPVPGPA